MAAEWRIELDTQLPLDQRPELTGEVLPVGDEATLPPPEHLRVAPVGAEEAVLTVPVGAAGAFSIPLGQLAPGYYRLQSAASETEGAIFAVPGPRPGPAGSADCLDFVRETVELLGERQSCLFGGDPQAARALTVSGPVGRSYLSLGHLEQGEYRTYWFPERPLILDPVLLDFELWPVLQQLTALTGDPAYVGQVEAMAEVFARHGFHPGSGLGYLGEEAGFDCLRLAGAPTKVNNRDPLFKPKNSGHFPGLPLDVLWRHAPEQMHRMCRAMYYGLITDPQSMDFNRFCDYEFRDRDRRHHLERNPGHCAFESAAGRMIHWWCACYRQTGDRDCLDYADRMLRKWEAIQHPASGLVPNFFGAVGWAPGEPMPPGEWAELRGTALLAEALLDAADELRQAPAADDLLPRLTAMAERLALGTARHGYDAADRLYHEWLHLDGRVYESTARYVFRTQAEKDAAVRASPALARVRVYRGGGLYRHQSYWELCAGTRIPLQLAQVAERTGRRDLLALVEPVAADALAEARAQPEAFTAEGGWTFRASGLYVKLLLSLYRQTGATSYLSGARELAELERERLGRVIAPDWWRMPERTVLLDAFLELHRTTRRIG